MKQEIFCFLVRLIQLFGRKNVRILRRKFKISKNVFNPKYFLTSEFMAKNLDVNNKDVLDIGTGSGIQAIVAAEKARKVVAVDINDDAVKIARENVKLNRLKNIRVIKSDLFENIKEKFDVILFTPPYMEGKLKDELSHALYDPNKDLIKRFFSEAGKYLKKKGYIQMIYSDIAELDKVLEIIKNLKWRYELIAEKKSLFECFFIYRFRKDYVEIVKK